MLPNPVVVPACAVPEVWLIALMGMWAEVGTEVAMLRRRGSGIDMTGSLVLFNVMTWLAFLMAIDQFDRMRLPLGWIVVGLETVVVAVESILIWSTHRSRARAASMPEIGFTSVVVVALVGNLVSIAVSIVPPVVIAWTLR